MNILRASSQVADVAIEQGMAALYRLAWIVAHRVMPQQAVGGE